MKHWEAAKTLGDYLLACNRQLFGLVTIDPRSQSERRILEALARCGNSATRRQIRQRINRQTMSSDEFAKSLEALCSDDTIVIYQDGRKTLYVRVDADDE